MSWGSLVSSLGHPAEALHLLPHQPGLWSVQHSSSPPLVSPEPSWSQTIKKANHYSLYCYKSFVFWVSCYGGCVSVWVYRRNVSLHYPAHSRENLANAATDSNELFFFLQSYWCNTDYYHQNHCTARGTCSVQTRPHNEYALWQINMLRKSSQNNTVPVYYLLLTGI